MSETRYDRFTPTLHYHRPRPSDPDFENLELRRRDILIVACCCLLYLNSHDMWSRTSHLFDIKFSYSGEKIGYPFSPDWVKQRYEHLKQTEDPIYLEWKDLTYYSPKMTELRESEGL